MVALVIIGVLILLNGLFVAAEFAIVGAPRLAIERRARAGQRIARLVHRILEQPREQDRFMATAQIGITLASLGLGMYGEAVVAGWIVEAFEWGGAGGWVAAHAVAVTLSIVILTYFHIVIGEMVPKSIALQRAEPAILWITPPMLWVRTLFYPLVIALNGIGNVVLRLAGIDRRLATGEGYYTPQELQLVFQESQDAGALPAESARLAREIFEFGDLEARQVMAPRVRVVGVAAGTGPDVVEEVLRRAPHTRYPVYTGDLDNVLGVVHVKDLLRLVLAGEAVGADHARPMPTVPETAPLDAVLAAMSRERAQMALVIDEHGGTAGIITLQDLFEEVVGPVDNLDQGAAIPTAEDGDLVRVPGTARLDEVGERFSVPLRHPDVDSVSGLVLAKLGRPPRVGDVVRFGRLRFEVTKVLGFGVGECAVSRLPPS